MPAHTFSSACAEPAWILRKARDSGHLGVRFEAREDVGEGGLLVLAGETRLLGWMGVATVAQGQDGQPMRRFERAATHLMGGTFSLDWTFGIAAGRVGPAVRLAGAGNLKPLQLDYRPMRVSGLQWPWSCS